MLMKTFQRAVRAGVGAAPYSSLKNSPTNESEWEFVSLLKNSPTNESVWEFVDEIEDEIEDETVARDFYDNYVFGTVPSRDEVHNAVFALQNNYVFGTPSRDEVHNAVFALQQVGGNDFICESSRGDSEEEAGNPVCVDDEKIPLDRDWDDWDEPSHSLYTSRMLQYSRSSDIAFHLLETDPLVQRMVVSLSSDQAVWNAVMNNELVKELRESIHGVSEESLDEESDEEGGDENILEWIVMFAKAKIMRVWEKMRELMSPNQEEENERRRGGDGGWNERVKTSFFLSMVVMIVVVLARAKNNTG